MPKIKLSATTIERQTPAPATGQRDFFDSAYPGLALRVSAKGVRSWVCFGRVHGEQKRVTLGRFPAVGLADARKLAATASDAMRSGIDVTVQKKAARATDRDGFATVVEEWFRRDQADNRSVAEVRRLFDRDVLPVLGRRHITDVKRRDIIALIDGIADRGAVTLARRTHSHLHRLFRWSVGRGILEMNPMGDLPKPGSETRRERFLTDPELAAFWRATARLGHPFGPLFRLLLLTGARREEIGALKWSEIDGDTIRLAGARTKNGQPHNIPLSLPAFDLIASLPRIEASQCVFTTNGRTAVSGFSRAKRMLDDLMTDELRAPPAPWRLHDIRRTLATGCQRLGINLQTIESLLGHIGGSRAGIVGVYQRHSYADEARAALEAWAQNIAALVDGGAGGNVVQFRAK